MLLMLLSLLFIIPILFVLIVPFGWNSLESPLPTSPRWQLVILTLSSLVLSTRGGSYAYYYRRAHFFLNFIDYNNLLDLNFSGPMFTWCNNQLGSSCRWARLDRGLVNSTWLDKFFFTLLSTYRGCFLIMLLSCLISLLTLVMLIRFLGLKIFGWIILDAMRLLRPLGLVCQMAILCMFSRT